MIQHLKDWLYRYRVDHFPRILIDKIWMREFGYTIDWNHPRDLNEKIQWLICYGNTSLWPLLADKYRVRNYISNKGYAHILSKLYGVWDDASDIDFDSLPEKFVLKCNHDSGSCHIIDKKTGFDKEKIISELNDSLKKKFGYYHCEPHYNKISPRIIAEEYLEQDDKSLSSSLIDYKVWCFNGKPYCIFTCRNREMNHLQVQTYDLDWKAHPEFSCFSDHFRDGGDAIPRPACLDQLLSICEDLSRGFPEVRADFYIINGKPIFGEFTFTSNFGRMSYFTRDFLIEMGNQVMLTQK